MTLTLVLIVLLLINPASRQEKNRPGAPLRIYLDTSISFYEKQREAIASIKELQKLWKFPIELYPFAYDVGNVRLLNQDEPEVIRTFERQTRYETLAATLKFLPPEEPKIVFSDFIFSDFFTPEQEDLLFLHKIEPQNSQTAFAIFIENKSGDYRPDAFQALTEGSTAETQYPLTVRMTVYASQTPASATLTLKTLAPYKRVLVQKPIQLTSRLETIAIPVSVRPTSFLSLEASLTFDTDTERAPRRVRDSLNLIGTSENIPVALFVFKPYKDISLIKRTIKRYGLFAIKTYVFLRKHRERLKDVEAQYQKYLAGISKQREDRPTPLILVMGADEAELNFFREQGQTFINLPKINSKTLDQTSLASQTLKLEHGFLNLTGSRGASEELWKKAAPFMRTHSQPLPAKAIPYQQNPDGTSFLFRDGIEMYVGLNGFYELNNSLIASANFSDADVFWVRLLEKLYAESTATRKKDYPHNYFLGEPVKDNYLSRTLSQLVESETGNDTITPNLKYARAYPLSNTYYHYRINLREYYPVYDFDETLFTPKEQLLTAIAEISEDYEQDKIITIRRLRSYQLPYILVLVFFLGYLLAKGIHSRL